MFTINVKGTHLIRFLSPVPSDYDNMNIVKYVKGYAMIRHSGDTWQVYSTILSIVFMPRKISKMYSFVANIVVTGLLIIV